MKYITIQRLKDTPACFVGTDYFISCFPSGKARITKTNIKKFVNFKRNYKFSRLSFVVWFSRNILKVNKSYVEKLNLIKINFKCEYTSLEESVNRVWNVIKKYVK